MIYNLLTHKKRRTNVSDKLEILSGKFISGNTEYCTVEKFVNAPYIRKSFNLAKFKQAKLYVTGLGFYRLFVNGEEKTKGLLCPYVSNPDDVIFYDCYDLSVNLKEGKNCFGFILGNGMQNAMGGDTWDMDKATFRSAPKLALSLEIDGKIVMEADETFKWKESPITFDDLRFGEHYDARLEIDGWADVDFDDASWKNCVYAVTDKGEKRISKIPPIEKYREITPKKIFKSENGYIYDFGYNSAGLCKIKICGDKGQKITLQYGEVINDGKINMANMYNPSTNKKFAHIDEYICKGQGCEEHLASFTYHSFQYVYVQGITEEQATEELLTFYLYSTKFDALTEFECSDDTINKLQQMCKNATLSNFYHFPTDCPHREKNGWTGDVGISVEQMLLNHDCADNLRQWMHNVRKAQREDGAFPGIVPTTGWGFAWGNGPAWDCVISLVPYYVYKYTGDKVILEENADSLYKYLQYMSAKRTDGYLCYGLGDWCEIMASPSPTTPLYFTDTLIGYNISKKAEEIYKVLGRERELKYAEQLSAELYTAIEKQFLSPKRLCLFETQTSYAMLVGYGILKGEDAERAVKRLVELIALNRNKLRTGILGARLIFHVLSDYGYGDLAHYMIADDKYPSYGEWVKKGQTSLWERFHETEDCEDIKTKNGYPVTSLNHHMYSDITQWFTKYITGIRVNPAVSDYKHIVVKPSAYKEITYAKGSYSRNGSKVSVEWVREGDEITLKVANVGDFRVEIDVSEYTIIEKIEKDGLVKYKLGAN